MALRKVRTSAIAVVALMVAPLLAGIAHAQTKSVALLLCPFGCGPMAGDTILMNQMILGGSKVIMLPQETPGYMYNVREMANPKHWKRSVFATEDVLIQLAFQGGSPELKEFLPKPVKIRFKLLYGEAWWGQGKFLVSFNPAFKSIGDLKGKRISLGLRGQSDWGVYARLFLEHGYGITPKNTDIRHLTPAQLTQQLIDGATDAAVTPFGGEPHMDFKRWLIPGPLRQLEATGKPLNYIGVSKEVVDKINRKFKTTWLYLTLPAGTLPKQTKPLGVAVNRGYKAVHPDFSEEAAYQIVMQVAKLGEKMKKLHGLWKIWSPELMLHGLSEENTHPGAIRAYKELGWWKRVKTEFADVAVTYPE